MITLRQIEALYWINALGTFARAANKLNTTQSAISKRIVELESSTGVSVFHRCRRGARLTEQGEQLLTIGCTMLELQDRMLMLNEGGAATARRMRIGVTELSALTWLPRLLKALRRNYPTVLVDPEVDLGRILYDRLLENELDLIVIPETFSDTELSTIRVGEVLNVWMASPDLVPVGATLSLAEIANYPILTQGRRSGTSLYVNNWLKAHNVVFHRALSCPNIAAQLAFAVAGLGIGYLPFSCVQPLVDEGKLTVVHTDPALPTVPYAALFHGDRPSLFVSAVADLTSEICDFSRQLQS